MSKNKTHRFEHTAKHYAEIWKFLKGYFESEDYDDCLSDKALADVVRANGIYCAPTIARDVRVANGVGNSDARRITQFRKHWESINKRTGNANK